MSRTWKDRPIHVRKREAMEAGHIFHDHVNLGRPDRSGITYWRRHELSVTFYKWATKEINAHRELLEKKKAAGEIADFTEESTAGYRILTAADGSFGYKTFLATVSFTVYHAYTIRGQEYCTDAEHYDPREDVDTRNGIRAVCTPDWNAVFRPNGRRALTRKRNERSEVRAALRKALTEIDMSDLEDEGYSDPTYELDYGRKIWYWDD